MLVTRTYLELRSPSQLRRVELTDSRARFIHLARCDTAHYRTMYESVGAPWDWTDRTKWSDARLAQQLGSANVAVWELRVGDTFAGFFELERGDDASVEIAYFGLVSAFFGQRLGAALLTRAADEAWALGAGRVWLHTCTLDSARALPNYQARGFVAWRVETYENNMMRDLPSGDTDLGATVPGD